MKRVCVDQNKCIGCGACVAINPENFDFNDDGLSEVKDENPVDKTIEAVEACPVFAISIEDVCECKDDKECTCENECKCGDNCTCGDECKCHENHECNCEECNCEECDCDECNCDSEDDEM